MGRPDRIERTTVWEEILLRTNSDPISNLSLREVPRFAGRRSNPTKNEIAAPFGLAMTSQGAFYETIHFGKDVRGYLDRVLSNGLGISSLNDTCPTSLVLHGG